MIRGQLNARLEAMLRLKVLGASGAVAEVDAIIDTGFTGSLVLPASVIEQLGLVKRSGGTATLADGTVRHFETFGAELEWDGMADGARWLLQHSARKHWPAWCSLPVTGFVSTSKQAVKWK